MDRIKQIDEDLTPEVFLAIVDRMNRNMAPVMTVLMPHSGLMPVEPLPTPPLNPKLPQMMIQMLIHPRRPLIRR
jgi:hypothetical protein